MPVAITDWSGGADLHTIAVVALVLVYGTILAIAVYLLHQSLNSWQKRRWRVSKKSASSKAAVWTPEAKEKARKRMRALWHRGRWDPKASSTHPIILSY
jgi:hypothetical protein